MTGPEADKILTEARQDKRLTATLVRNTRCKPGTQLNVKVTLVRLQRFLIVHTPSEWKDVQNVWRGL